MYEEQKQAAQRMIFFLVMQHYVHIIATVP